MDADLLWAAGSELGFWPSIRDGLKAPCEVPEVRGGRGKYCRLAIGETRLAELSENVEVSVEGTM